MRIVVVDNNTEPECEAALADIVPLLPFAVQCVHEPDPGIPQARNRAVETALQYTPDFLAFIDDDETIDSQWLVEMSKAHESYGADVYQGRVIYQLPSPAPFWAVGKCQNDQREAPKPSGCKQRGAATNNVLFTSALVVQNGMGLRFQESLRFSGGSDSQFFGHSYELGAHIVYNPSAVTYETIPHSRLTLKYQLSSEYRKGINRSIKIKLNGQNIYSHGKIMRNATKRIVSGVFNLFLAILFVIVFRDPRRKILGGLRAGWRAAGLIAGRLGYQAQPYKR